MPSQDSLRRDGFAVWPEDTAAEGMNACEQAESWQHDSTETALRFARDVLEFSEPRVSREIAWGPGTIRFFISAPTSDLPMLVDARKHDRCWFVVGATPREGELPATLAFIHRPKGVDLAIRSTGERTHVGYGPWAQTILGNEQTVLSLPPLEPDATGHVIALGCGQLCDASAWTLGFVPERGTTGVAKIAQEELVGVKGACRTGSFGTQLRALVHLYAMHAKKPIGTRYGKPSVGNRRIERVKELERLGVTPLASNRWLSVVDGVALEAQVLPVRDRCWIIASIDDPRRDVLGSLHIGEQSLTLDIRWGKATSAVIRVSSFRGGDSWELDRLNRPFTVTVSSPRPLQEPFVIEVSLRKGDTLISHERTWYRSR